MASNKAQLNWWRWLYVRIFQIRQMKSIGYSRIGRFDHNNKNTEMGEKETEETRQGQRVNGKRLKSVRFHRSLTSSNTKMATQMQQGRSI